PADLLLRGFWDLVEYMVVTPDGGVVSDIMKIRSIFRWMMSYDVFTIDTDIIPPDESLLEYMMNIQCDLADHAHFLYTLCSLADIPCVIINGVTKNELYEIGGKLDREKMASQWNAVYIDGQWRLVDCFWASACVETKGPRDFITMNKKKIVKRIRNGDVASTPFNEFYFLVDPSELINTHFPDDPEWQLLRIPVSQEAFQDRLYIREQFHLLEFSFPPGASEKGTLISYHGEPVEIKFLVPSRRSLFYKFAYILSQARKEVETNDPVDIVLERYVILEHTEESVKLIIRFPFCGIFQMDFYAADEEVSKEYKLVFTYNIECKEITKTPDMPLPDSPDIGWGCSPIAIDAGITLVKPKESAIIHTKTGQLELTFSIEAIGFLSHTLKSCSIDDATLSQYVITKRDKDKFMVQMRLPKAGEYALKIHVDDARYMKDYMPRDLVNYFIVFEGNKTNVPFPHISGGTLGTKLYAERFGVEVLSYPNGIVKAWGGKARLEFETHSDNIALTCDMCGFNRESNARMSAIAKHFEDHWLFDVNFPKAGEYSVNVYAILKDEETVLYEVQSYLITAIVQNDRRVKFEDDNEVDDIITASIRTSEETIVIPIPKAEDCETIYTKIQRQDGKDGEIEDRATVKNLGDSFEINIKEDGEYMLDVWVQDDERVLEKVAKFTINRRHSFDSYTDDIEALIELLKPREKEQEQEPQNDEMDEEYHSENGYDGHSNNETDEENEDKADDQKDEEESYLDSRLSNHVANDIDDDDNEELDRQIQEGLAKGGIIANGINQDKQDVYGKELDKMSAINEESEYESSERDKYSVKSADTRYSSVTETAITTVIIANQMQEEGTREEVKLNGHLDEDGSQHVADIQVEIEGNSPQENGVEHSSDEEKNDMDDPVEHKNDERRYSETDRVASRALESAASLFILDVETVQDEELKARLTEAKRRLILRRLRKAIKEKRLKELTTYYDAYKSLTPYGGDDIRKEARKIINHLKAKENLMEATLCKDPVMLRDAIVRAQKHNSNMSLTVQILLATRILEHLNRVKKISSTVLELNQNAITEMKKYQKPPDGVHQSLAAAFLLLGEKPKELKKWKSCQKLLYRVGKDSVTRMISAFDPKDANMDRVHAAQKIMRHYDVVQIRDVSKGAAAFFSWAKHMIQEIESYYAAQRKPRSGKSGRHHYPRSSTMTLNSATREGTKVMKI
ncbi:hypothetical protein FSP39_017265, partial [Pinctada imbricata]